MEASERQAMNAKILIVDDEPYLVRLMEYALKAEGYEILTAATGADAIRKAETERPDLVLLDVMLPDLNGIEVAQHLRSKPHFLHTPIIMLSALSQVTDKIEGLKAGADEYLTKPVDLREMVVRVSMLLERRALTQPKSAPPAPRGKIVAVCGPKGGIGRTFTAVNLALALPKIVSRKIMLLDGNHQLGDIDLALNLRQNRSFADLLARADRLDSELVRTVSLSHSGGIEVILSASHLSETQPVQPDAVRQVVAALTEMCDYLVVDTQSVVDDFTETIINSASVLIVLVQAEISACRNARQLLELVRENGFNMDNLIVVLNQFNTSDELQASDIEKILYQKISVKIPTNHELVQYSLNRGVPVVVSHPKHTVSAAIFQLADMVAGSDDRRIGATSSRGLFEAAGSIFGRRSH